MDKLTLELEKIQQLKIVFVLPITKKKQDDRYSIDTISHYIWDGQESLKINPRPKIRFDYSPKDGGDLSYVSMTKAQFFYFLQKLEAFIETFKDENLYQYAPNGKLLVNLDLAVKYRLDFTAFNKSLQIKHCVVTNEDTGTTYEGGCLFVNHVSNYILFTYMELGCLLQSLKQVNFHTLSMELLNYAKQYGTTKTDRPMEYVANRSRSVSELTESDMTRVSMEAMKRPTSIIPNL